MAAPALASADSAKTRSHRIVTMTVDHIRYDILAQEALRGMLRTLLVDTARKGLPGEHHFFISFDTHADGVRLSARLREQYPEEMTIILQHQFWDLKVSDDGFEVGLSFSGVAERLAVPFAAITSFVDPSVQFALQFEAVTETQSDAATPAKTKQQKTNENPIEKSTDAASGKSSDKLSGKTRRSVRHEPTRTVPRISAPAPANPSIELKSVPSDDKPDKPTTGGEVVRLDRFRKK
jgi:uncharacterized protein